MACTPARIAQRLAGRLARSAEPAGEAPILWNRETLQLPREQAGAAARAFLARYPEDAHRARVESWRRLDNGLIEITLRRLPEAG